MAPQHRLETSRERKRDRKRLREAKRRNCCPNDTIQGVTKAGKGSFVVEVCGEGKGSGEGWG